MNREVDPYEIPRSWLSPSPQDDCEDCEGAGLVEVTERSDSRFACFGIGGRWKGAFDATGAGREILLIADLVPDELPAVVTHPDGRSFIISDLNDGFENSTEPDAPRAVDVPSAEWAGSVAGVVRDHAACMVIRAGMYAEG